MKQKKNPEKDFRKWSIPFFQIGLIMALLISWLAIEGKTYHLQDSSEPYVLSQNFVDPIETIEVFEKKVEKSKPKPLPPKTTLNNIKVSDKDDFDDTEPIDLDDLLKPTDGDHPTPVDIDQVTSIDKGITKTEDIDPIPYQQVQDVPIFPGCERYKDNNRRMDCLNKSVHKFIIRRFDTDRAAHQGISGVNRMNVQFMVDETGTVTDVKVLAREKVLENEAKRVISLLPSFQPGKQNDKPVKVIYTISIVLDIH